MKNSINAAGLALLLAVLPLGAAGCLPAAIAVGAGMGYGAAKYVEGSVVSDLHYSLPRVYRAAKATMTGQGGKPVSGSHGTLDGELKGETAAGRRVTMAFKSLNPEKTELTVRVGLLGDTRAAEMLLHQVVARLKAGGGTVREEVRPRRAYVPQGMVAEPPASGVRTRSLSE